VEAFWADSLGRRIGHGNLHYILELPRTYRKAVRERTRNRRFDVVQLSQPYCYLAARMLRRRPNAPLTVWRSHGLEAKVDDAISRHGGSKGTGVRALLRAVVASRSRWSQREAVRWSDGVIVPCADDKQYLLEHFGARDERVRVIWHGVPDEFILRAVGLDPGRWQRLLHVSQLSANKGPQVMREVATRVLREQSDLSMTWVCPAALHGTIHRGLPDDVRDRVELLDWASRDALLGLYDSHGLFLFPTLAEGAAKVVMEAMARGMCVVASDTSGPRDYIRTGKNGVLVAVGDSGSMAAAACDLGRFPERARAMGEEARVTASRFRWSRCASEMVAFYSDLQLLRHSPRD
jgi:glycosyltransferase involved in cell wall biosynthesis